MKYRIIWTLVLLLGILLLPLTAGAETKTGTCGTDLTYTLTDDGTLTISGTGAMYNYGSTPSQFINAERVVIGNGVTSIGGNAFYQLFLQTEIYSPFL